MTILEEAIHKENWTSLKTKKEKSKSVKDPDVGYVQWNATRGKVIPHCEAAVSPQEAWLAWTVMCTAQGQSHPVSHPGCLWPHSTCTCQSRQPLGTAVRVLAVLLALWEDQAVFPSPLAIRAASHGEQRGRAALHDKFPISKETRLMLSISPTSASFGWIDLCQLGVVCTIKKKKSKDETLA